MPSPIGMPTAGRGVGGCVGVPRPNAGDRRAAVIPPLYMVATVASAYVSSSDAALVSIGISSRTTAHGLAVLI